MTAGVLLAVGHGALLQAGAALPGLAGVPLVGALLGGASPSPSPSPSAIEIPPEDQTSPGFLGFVVTFGVAVAVILLGFSLVRHLRVVERNGRRLEAEEAAADEAGSATTGTGHVAPRDGLPHDARATDDPSRDER
ncbi:MAG TPA: hypothetical protein VGC57_16605 [Cellulomonas sp.]